MLRILFLIIVIIIVSLAKNHQDPENVLIIAVKSSPKTPIKTVLHDYLIKNKSYIMSPQSAFPRSSAISNQHEIFNKTAFLIYVPYQGISNQLNSLLRALVLSAALNRTLLIPPLFPSHHDDGSSDPAQWENFLNFSAVSQSFSFYFLASSFNLSIFLDQDKDNHCITFGKWHMWWQLGLPAVLFRKQFHWESISLKWHKLPSPPSSRDILKIMQSQSQSKLICIANLQHVHFSDPLVNHLLSRTEYTNQILRSVWLRVRDAKYTAVHWRRGDFKTACRNKNMSSCYPDTLPAVNDPKWFACSDQCVENSPEWITTSSIERFFLDSCLMTYSDRFIGNRYSTVSKHVFIRRQAMGKPFEAY